MIESLTPQEYKILLLIAQGFPTKQVAEKIGVRRRTVESHLVNARQKFDARNTLHLVVLALDSGIITLEEICHKPTTY